MKMNNIKVTEVGVMTRYRHIFQHLAAFISFDFDVLWIDVAFKRRSNACQRFLCVYTLSM